MDRTTIGAAALVAALCLPLTACAPSTSGEPITLTIGTDDSPGIPSAAQIEQFAKEVDELSDGRITIEPVWGAAGSGIPDWDQAIAGMAIDGDLDLALVPSRSWDALGVTTLRPLNAPFLIDSDALVEQVLTSGLPATMMAGLADAGVEGIGMWPEGLRHPFGFSAALGGPSDYEGAVVRVATSTTATELFEALGATTNDAAPSAIEHTAIESSFLLDPGGTATGNVTFFPKVNVLVGGSDRLAQLGDADRSILETAAERVQTWAFDTQPTDPEAAAAFCDGGGSVVLAPTADVDAMKAAAKSVLDDIAADAGNAEVLTAIDALKAALPEQPAVEECAGGTSSGSVDAVEASSLDGTYRTVVTEDELLAGGVGPGEANGNAGTYTFTLVGGTWTMHWEAPAGSEDYDGSGTYQIEGDQVTFIDPSVNGEDTFSWERSAGATLSMTPVTSNDLVVSVVWGHHPWDEIPAG